MSDDMLHSDPLPTNDAWLDYVVAEYEAERVGYETLMSYLDASLATGAIDARRKARIADLIASYRNENIR